MDIQKTMEFILEQQAHSAALQAKNDEEIAKLHEETAELHKAIAESRKIGERTDRRLDRAIELSVREFRNERLRRQELDAKMNELADGLKSLKEMVQAFVESMRRGGNGHR